MKKIVWALSACLLMVAGVQAANVNVSWTGAGATDDWNDPANWGGVIPGATTEGQPVFDGTRDNSTPTKDFAFVVASDVGLRNEVVVTIGPGVNISNFKDWRLGGNATHEGGHVIMTGGSLSGRSFLVASIADATGRSTFTVSGGSLTTSAQFSLGALADFNLTGNTAVFSIKHFTAAAESVFNAVFSSSGISKIVTSGDVKIDEAGAKLNVDLSAFAGVGDFDLITFGRPTSSGSKLKGGYSSKNVAFSGLGGRTATLESDADSLYVHIVPKPAAVGTSKPAAGAVSKKPVAGAVSKPAAGAVSKPGVVGMTGLGVVIVLLLRKRERC